MDWRQNSGLCGKAIMLLCLLSFGLSNTPLAAQSFPQRDTTGGWLTQAPMEVLFPHAPLKVQALFIGGYDSVLTHRGMALSKGRNDYTTFVPITPGVADSGYVLISHEIIQRDSMIGDGGGMTVIKVVREGDSLRKVGVARAVDFRPVGGTLGNCGGITGPDGQVWTGEEPMRTTNISVGSADTADVILGPLGQAPDSGQVYNDIPGDFSGRTLKAYQNYNYMVKVDPVQAVAVRKQYNWGRMQHEGGAVLADNRTVIITPDDVPAFLVKFVADAPGDFSSGKTFAFRGMYPGPGSWVEIDNTSLDSMLMIRVLAARKGCSLFYRLEWAGYHNGKVYFTETGGDLPQSGFRTGRTLGAGIAWHHLQRARNEYTNWVSLTDEQVADSICFSSKQYHDFYGRVLVYDPATDEVKVFLEGGPRMINGAPYPEKHFSNPDGLTFLSVSGRNFMIVAEDLIGTSAWRIHPDANAGYSEIYALDMAIDQPQVTDLMRIAVMPMGAEATGTATTPDGKTVFFTSQHPLFSNPFPYNHSVTFAVSGWESLVDSAVQPDTTAPLVFWPNPVSSRLFFSKVQTGSVYSSEGRLMRTFEKVRNIDMASLPAGIYLIRFESGKTAKIICSH
jgi:secreted PhoX family phosphatase